MIAIKTILAGLVAAFALHNVAPLFDKDGQVTAIKNQVSAASHSQTSPFDLGGGRTINGMLNQKNSTFSY